MKIIKPIFLCFCGVLANHFCRIIWTEKRSLIGLERERDTDLERESGGGLKTDLEGRVPIWREMRQIWRERERGQIGERELDVWFLKTKTKTMAAGEVSFFLFFFFGKVILKKSDCVWVRTIWNVKNYDVSSSYWRV